MLNIVKAELFIKFGKESCVVLNISFAKFVTELESDIGVLFAEHVRVLQK